VHGHAITDQRGRLACGVLRHWSDAGALLLMAVHLSSPWRSRNKPPFLLRPLLQTAITRDIVTLLSMHTAWLLR
jgi:hypothetical protein